MENVRTVSGNVKKNLANSGQRTLKVLARDENLDPVEVFLDCGRGNTGTYALTWNDTSTWDGSNDAVHVRWAKVDGGTDPEAEDYDVFLVCGRPGLDTCECKGWYRWNKCKHLDASRALQERRR